MVLGKQISIDENLNTCSQGPYRAVQCAIVYASQGPVNTILSRSFNVTGPPVRLLMSDWQLAADTAARIC
jgi:hypothetical protein